MGQQPLHLAAIEGDGEAAEAIDGDCAFLGHFHREGLGLVRGCKGFGHLGQLCFEGFVLLLKVREKGHWKCSYRDAAEVPVADDPIRRSFAAKRKSQERECIRMLRCALDCEGSAASAGPELEPELAMSTCVP